MELGYFSCPISLDLKIRPQESLRIVLRAMVTSMLLNLELNKIKEYLYISLCDAARARMLFKFHYVLTSLQFMHCF